MTGEKPSILARVQTLVERYGPMALVVWFAVFFANIGVVVLLLEVGLRTPWIEERLAAASPWLTAQLVWLGIESPWVLAHGVTLAAGYLVAKALMPARFVIVAALLPVVARRRAP